MPAVMAVWRGRECKNLCLSAAKTKLRERAMEYYMRCREECPVDTGKLRDSHRFQAPSAYTYRVIASTDYAPFVHEGTSRMKANPWMLRAAKRIGIRRLGTLSIK